jgi:hypothetical protein
MRKMQARRIQVKNGRLALDEPTDLPDGAEVEIFGGTEVLLRHDKRGQQEQRDDGHATTSHGALSPITAARAAEVSTDPRGDFGRVYLPPASGLASTLM